MALKLRAKVQFPALVEGEGGIKVSKSGGIWTIEPAFDNLAAVAGTAISDPSLKQVWIFDPTTLQYNVLTLAGLGDALYLLTSTTSNTIGTGSKTFTVQANKDIAVGSWLLLVSDAAASTNFMVGQVAAYSTTILTVNVTYSQGSGTHTDWTMRISSPQGPIGKSAGWSYAWATSTASSDPGSGAIKANNATLSSVTALYISESDADGNSLASTIATWDDGSSTIRGRLKIYSPTVPSNFASFNITGTNTDNGTWDTINVSYVNSGGSFSAADALRIEFFATGDKGDIGATGSSGLVPSYLAGLTLSTAGSSATYGIAAGVAADSTNAASMTLSSAYTKTTSAWALGTAAGSLDTGAIANSTWYHVWLIQRSDTSVVDVLCSLSASAPTMPTNYDRKRRIGSMKTNGSAQWILFLQNGDEFMWNTMPALDYNTTNPGTAAVTVTTSVPTGVKLLAKLNVVGADVGALGLSVLLSSLDIADTAPGTSTSPLGTIVVNSASASSLGCQAQVMTNTSAQIRMRASSSGASTSVYIQTTGWVDRRGRDS